MVMVMVLVVVFLLLFFLLFLGFRRVGARARGGFRWGRVFLVAASGAGARSDAREGVGETEVIHGG